MRPIDPAAWISHTTALTGPFPHYGKDSQSLLYENTLSNNSDSGKHIYIFPHSFSISEFDDLPLSVGKTDMATIVKVMQLPDSGLEIRDRMWLKITIANAVIGEKSRAKRYKHTHSVVLKPIYCKSYRTEQKLQKIFTTHNVVSCDGIKITSACTL